MSYLSRHLQRSIESLNGSTSYLKDLVSYLDDWWHNCALMNFWYKLKWVWNNRWLFKHIWTFRTYSAEFSIELFCDSLVAQAEGNRLGWSINAEKDYKRCLYMAERLRKAYIEDLDGKDKSAVYQRSNNPMEMVELGPSEFGSGTRVTIKTQWHISEEYGRKIEKVVDKRVEVWRQQRRRDAWDYFMKYYYKFGD